MTHSPSLPPPSPLPTITTPDPVPYRWLGRIVGRPAGTLVCELLSVQEQRRRADNTDGQWAKGSSRALEDRSHEVGGRFLSRV